METFIHTLSLINIIMAFLISIMAFIYSLVSPDRRRKVGKFFIGLNYLIITGLLVQRIFISKCNFCAEISTIITLYNMTMFFAMIDAFSGLVIQQVKVRKELLKEFKKQVDSVLKR
jgi:hypothetical protein